MKAVCFTALFALLVFCVSANEKEKLRQESKTVMDRHYKGVISELRRLQAAGMTYKAKDIKALATVISVTQFANSFAQSPELVKLLDKLKKSGELGDFKVEDQGSPELKKEMEQAISDLISKDDLSPRVIGAAITGTTQIITDTIRMLLTRYTEPR